MTLLTFTNTAAGLFIAVDDFANDARGPIDTILLAGATRPEFSLDSLTILI